MAYDPEARETSNSAMIIGIVALVLVVGGALAYFATRPNDPVAVPTSSTTVIERDTTPDVAAPAPSPVVVERETVVQQPVVVPGNTTRIERERSSTTTRVVPSGNAPSGTSGTTPENNVNVTVNNPAPTESGASGSAEAASNTASGAATSAATPSAGY
jgi:hypothetical protein